jgi:hypothetical protein
MNDARIGSRPHLSRLHGLTLLSTFAVLTLAACSSDEDAPPAQQVVGAGTGGAGATGGAGTGGATGGSGGDGAGGATGGTGGATGGTGGATGGGSGAGTGGSSGGGQGGSAGGPPIMEPREALPCFADEGTPAGAAIDLQLVPSRVTGVAPLLVFFETDGTTSDATDKPFHELAYCWDFDDAMAGSFTTTGLSKNAAKGPNSSHVFETPGTHTVTVSARDAMGRVTSRSVEVTVEDPEAVFAGASTVCLSDDGDFTGCPDGAQQVTGTSFGDLSSYVATGMRLLAKRGGTFSGNLNINVPGPGMIGAFGDQSAPKPHIDAPDQAVFKFSDKDPTCNDWRVVDLSISGTDNTKAIEVSGTMFDLLVLRLQTRNVLALLTAGDSIIDYWNNNGSPGADVTDVLGIHDCDSRHTINGGNHIYAAAHRMSMQGNYIHDSIEGEHLIRTPWFHRGVFSNNDLGEAPQPRTLLKLHAPKFTNSTTIGYQQYSERVVISDNIFNCVGGNQWSVVLGPQNSDSDERLRDILVERNLFLPGDAAQQALLISATGVTVRDNLMNRGPQRACIGGGRQGVEPPTDDIVLLNNTCYSDASSGPALINFDPSTTNLRGYNNLLVGPNASESALSPQLVDQIGNLVVTSAAFADPTLTKWQDFAVDASDPAVDAADPAYWSAWDFTGRPRPVDGNADGTAEPDVGAMEVAP